MQYTKDKRQQAVNLIKKKLNKKTYLEYNEFAFITGYHPKYILKLKQEVIDGTVKLEHGNKHRTPSNVMGEKEKQYIIDLYKRSNVSIRKFCNFYNKRSYSCIYNLLRNEGLLNNEK